MVQHLVLTIPAKEMALRKALAAVREFLHMRGFTQDTCGTVELVLAEAMNNIIEHAYTGTLAGEIDLRIDVRGNDLFFSITDDGTEMPGDGLPKGKQHDLACDTQDLPEGGFGWFLIRELTHSLSYERVGKQNKLAFTIRTDGLAQ